MCKTIRTVKDAQDIIDTIKDDEMLRVYPEGKHGNLEVLFTRNGYRQFWLGDVGNVDNCEGGAIALYSYRKIMNNGNYEFKEI